MDPVAEQHHLERQARIARAPQRRETLTHVVSVAALLSVCVALAVLHTPSLPDPILAVVLLALCAPFWQVDFEIGPTATTPMQLLLVPMWFAFDPALLPLAVAAGQFAGAALTATVSGEQYHWRRAIVAVSDSWFAVGPAVVFACFGSPEPTVDAWAVCLGALAAQFGVDGISNVIRARANGTSLPGWNVFGWMCMIDASLAPIGFLTAIATVLSPLTALAVAPLTAILWQFARERDARIKSAVELSGAYRGTAHLMGEVLEADDAYTGGEHTQGVVGLALDLGKAMGLSPRQMRDLEFGALLHDIGKLRVPKEIINKPGKLTQEEWAIIKLHPGYGQEMLDRVGGELSRAGVIVRAHHERWDGGGYPDGLEAETIPVEARIITVCDSYSAMTTDRSYRKGMSVEDALDELERCAGSQFDPAVVRAAMSLLSGPERAQAFPKPKVVGAERVALPQPGQQAA